MTKTLTVIVILIALAGGGAWWYYNLGPGAAPAQAAAGGGGGAPGGFAIPVETAPAQLGTVTRAVEAVGTLRANESVVLRPEQAGRIATIRFEEGQQIKAGTPLVTLDASVFEAELDQARARLNLSQTNSERINSLRGRGLGTEQELDQTRSELRVAQAALALAQTQLDKMTIEAPFDGVLGLRSVSVGDYVSPGDPLANLLDLDPIKVDFRVPEVFLSEVKVGQTVEVIVDAFPDETFQGEVYAIDPQVDVNGRALVLRARIDNSESRLQAGLFARVNLILERRDGALLIPEIALVPQGDQQYVFTINEGTAKMLPVTIGRRQGDQVEVTTGLEAQMPVITAGQLKIRDGAPVQALPPPATQQEG